MTDPRSDAPPTLEEMTALLEKCVRDYEDSAYACDSPLLARFRAERTKIAADLRRLASHLPEMLRAEQERERLEDVIQVFNSERHALIDQRHIQGLTAAEITRLDVVTEIVRAAFGAAKAEDYTGIRDALKRSAERSARVDAIVAEIGELTDAIRSPAPSSVQGMIDERARLGKALEDSQADIRAAAREGDAR